MDIIYKIINILADIFTILASGMAIYLFVVNRDKISSMFNILLNYSTQATLTDLYSKIERLNSHNVNDENQKTEVINILNEILGQINGNKKLGESLKNIYKKIKIIIKNKNITEPEKRSIVSELRESLRGINLTNYKDIINIKNE